MQGRPRPLKNVFSPSAGCPACRWGKNTAGAAQGAMKHILIFLIRIYQRLFSPLLPPACRFYPTCSQYFAEALRKKGLIKGFAMGVWRILRCNPFSRGGFDPVE